MNRPAPTRSPAARTFRWLLTAIAGVVVVLVVAYLARGVFGEVRMQQRTTAIKERLADEIGAQRPSVEQGREAARARLRADLGEPTHSWIAQECSFDSQDAGWFPKSYLQNCALRAYDVYPVNGDADTAAAALDRLAGAEIGVPPENHHPVAECSIVTTRREADTGPRRADGVDTYVLSAAPPPREQFPCNWLRADGRIGEAARTVAGERPTQPLEGSTHVVVVHTRSLGSHDLGCSPWGIVFCNNPLDEPVLATSRGHSA